MQHQIGCLVIFIGISAGPAFAQYSSDIWVIGQSQNGLDYPSSSYIGPGSLSKTAQESAGYHSQSNVSLPKVNRGAYYGTPGDNMYSDHPDLSQRPKQINYARKTIRIQKPVSDKQSHIYAPDPNIPMSYSDLQTDAAQANPENKTTKSPANCSDNVEISK